MHVIVYQDELQWMINTAYCHLPDYIFGQQTKYETQVKLALVGEDVWDVFCALTTT